MTESQFASLDDLSLQKENVSIYAIDEMKVEVYDDETSHEVMFPPRLHKNKDIQEMQELHSLDAEIQQLHLQLEKVEQALTRLQEDSSAQEQISSDPEKRRKLAEIKAFQQQLKDSFPALQQRHGQLLQSCMQQFIQYVSLVPDNLIANWRYEKGYLLVFLHGKPQFFNSDTDTVTFSDLWKHGPVYTVRGKINDFYKKIYMEFIVIWKQLHEA